MKFRISRFNLIVCTLLLLELNFFCIIPIPNSFYVLNSHFHKVATLIIAIIAFVIWLSSRRNRYALGTVVKTFLVSWVFIYFASVLIYENTSFTGAFLDYYYFWILLIYYYMSDNMVRNENNFKYVKNIICKFSVVYCLILLLQWFFLNYGLVFLTFNNNYLSVGENRRMTAGTDFVLFSAVFLCTDLCCTNKLKRTVFAIIVEFLYLLFVSQSRSAAIIYIVLLYFSVFTNVKNQKLRKLISAASVVFLGIAVYVSMDSIVGFFLANRGSSFRQRIREIEFYTGKIFDNILFGIGFLRDSPSNSRILHGFENLYYISDIGVVGFASIWGVIGIALFVYTIFKMVLEYKNVDKRFVYDRAFARNLILYFLLTSINLSLFDPQRIIYFPMILAFMTYVSNKKKLGDING